MGKNTICEEILPGPWHLREGVTQPVLPIQDLESNGSAHVEIPSYLLKDLEGPYTEWLSSAKDGESLELGKSGFSVFLQRLIPGTILELARIRRVDREWNNWHYDICPGLTDAETYDIQTSITSEHRASLKEEAFYVTVPFPINWHGPTVVVPWAGPYEGRAVQAPLGYATIFDPHRAWHRGDRWEGAARGIYLMSLRRKGETNGKAVL